MKKKILDLKEKYLEQDIISRKKKTSYLLLMLQDQYNHIITRNQKIINLLDDTANQPSKFRTKNWVEINDQSLGTYNSSN